MVKPSRARCSHLAQLVSEWLGNYASTRSRIHSDCGILPLMGFVRSLPSN